MKRYALLAVGTFAWIIADQLTKLWAVDVLVSGGLPGDPLAIRSHVLAVFDGWFHLKVVGNTGAAWGLFGGLPTAWRVPFFGVISLVAIGVIAVIYRRSRPEQNLLRWALTFILGGAIGNLIDRIRIGYVVDFIDWFYGDHHWPTFNSADVAISIGVVLLVLDMWAQRGRRGTHADAAEL